MDGLLTNIRTVSYTHLDVYKRQKEIIARDNEISILRKEDISKAYFGCHTDITIPYDELGSICVPGKNGEKISIIEDGRFVLAGTEELNKPFEAVSYTHLLKPVPMQLQEAV